MEIKTSDSYQKEILAKYKRERGGEMSSYLLEPTRKKIREACLWLLERRKEKNDEYILNQFFHFKVGENKVKHVQGLKSDKADKFVPIIQFLKEKTTSTSSENLELISWLIDFQPRPLQEYLKSKNIVVEDDSSDKHNSKGKDITVENKTKKNTVLKEATELRKEEKSDSTTLIQKEVDSKRKISKINIALLISIVLVISVLNFTISQWHKKSSQDEFKSRKCMTWTGTKFEMVSCDTGPYSKYGTKVKPLQKAAFNNMQKVEVSAAYKFFSDNGNPLIWYYKKRSKVYEFFTAPGLHPVTGKTLKEITPYIIDKYVPKHIYNKNSFIP